MFPALSVAAPAQHLFIVAAVVLAWLFPFTYRGWHKESHDLMQKLSDEGHESPRDQDDDCITYAALKQRIEKLPEVVQRYFKSILPLPNITKCADKIIPFARSLRIEQEGTFLMNEKWIPFTATQEFSCRQTHPGFVWDAVMEKACFGGCNMTIPILVRDAYITGVGGIMKAQLPMGIPLVNMKDTPELNMGEIMRWVAEATLFPMALIPQICDNNSETILKWSPGTDESGNSAILECKHKTYNVQIEFYFDPETHMVTTIKAKRPRTVGDKTEMTDWEGHCSDYELHGGVLVPTKMEVGWKLSDETPLELYFRGKNTKFIYLMNAHTRNEHVPEDKQALISPKNGATTTYQSIAQ
jgi:hypothetical protein